ncbi:MAG: phage tail sheath subtilisin-like domain-containing protein [Proteobacteria bacterium]|nr:phage tail sheath subtilisin-like domain-containing protein [Pseudomonadota bacterium]
MPSVPTSVTGAVGLTERGPIGQAVLCTTWEEFQDRFGGFTPNSELALAALGFFENGGSQLWVVRTVHHDDVSDPTTATAIRAFGYLTSTGVATPAVTESSNAEPFALHDGDRISLHVHGSPHEVVFQGSAAQVAAGGPGPFALADGQTLHLSIDQRPEQRIRFSASDFDDIGQATTSELAAALNAQIVGGKAFDQDGVLTLASDTEGTRSRIQVTGGTANPALGFPTQAVPGSGNVGDIRATTLAEVKTLLESAVPGVVVEAGAARPLRIATVAIGAEATLQIQPDTAAAFGLDTDLHTGSDTGVANGIRVEGKDPGAYANRIQVEVHPATSGDSRAFDLAVVEDGVVRELFANLTMEPDDEQYIERVIGDEPTGSRLIRVIDQLSPLRPVPDPQSALLHGGDDGLAGLGDTDFIGSEAGKTGLYALDHIQDLSVLLVPGHATPAIHNAMVRYGEVHRHGLVFAVLDPPADHSATDIVEYVTDTASLLNLTEYAALYWPRVNILNPQKSVFGPSKHVVAPPSGIIAGVYARTDSERPGGVYDPPAGIDKGRMFGVLGFETGEVLEESKRDLVYPKRINPLTTESGLPRYIDGSRTLKGTGNFPYVAERRGVLFIERSLKRGLQFARHKNNTEGLRAQVRRTIYSFLLTQMNNGAFRSREPQNAFFVDVSEQLNTPSVIFAGKLIVRIGLATNKPAEFVVLRLSQDTRALEAELAAAGI